MGGDGETCQSEEHPGGEVAERRGWGDRGPEDTGDAGRGEVPRGLDGGQQPERGAAQVRGCQRGDGGVFGGFDAADALVPEALAGLASPGMLAAPRVVFVCTQNSARSQLAAALWSQSSPVPAASAGTDPARRVHPRAVSVGRRHGLALGRARTSHLGEVLRPDDLVVAVCDNA